MTGVSIEATDAGIVTIGVSVAGTGTAVALTDAGVIEQASAGGRASMPPRR